MKLNAQQQQAVDYLDGSLFVLAGAGSGKTRVITEKIATMLTQHAYRPQDIFAITFTNKTAKEMQERIVTRLGKERTKGLTVSTFHSLGMKILREDAPLIGYKRHFSILDGSDTASILSEIMGVSGRDVIGKMQHKISLWKNNLQSPEHILQLAQNDLEYEEANIFASYQTTLKNYQAVDFDDLISLVVALFIQQPEILRKWQNRIRYLLVDECQDTNACQYALMRLLVGERGMFTVVGDDDQSIYAWRGANMENLRRLQDDFPNLKIIKLEQNYRSTARILRVANQVIGNNPKLFPKTLWSQLGEGDSVRVVACPSEQDEVRWIVDDLQRTKAQYGVNLSDFAILYRGNHQARLFEEHLRLQRIPYQLSGGQSFFDKAEIKDILAYMRLLVNPQDDPAFLRAATTPKRGIGDVSLGKLNEYAKKHECSLYDACLSMTALAELNTKNRESIQQFVALIREYRERAVFEDAGEVIQDLLNDIQYEQYLFNQDDNIKSSERRWANVQNLAQWLSEKADDKNLIELSQTIALMTLLEGKEEGDSDQVKLSTLHAAKGLEYAFVYLVGCEEGILPHSEYLDEDNIAEERRLMYVGITRAKRQLTLTHCIKRKKQGETIFPEPSRFINEMPQDELRILGRKGGEPIVSKEEGRLRIQEMLAHNKRVAEQKRLNHHDL